MSANRRVFSRPTKSIMQFLLYRDESIVFFLIKLNPSQDSASNKRSDLLNLNRQNITEGSIVIEVVGADSVT